MWNRKRSVILSIAVCFAFLAILTVLVLAGPKILEIWFTAYRGFDKNGFALNKMLVLFKACFYPCAIFAYVTLYSLIKLLFNIKKEEIFITQNIKYLRRISWCCFAVAVITIVGGIFYIPFLFITAAAAFVGLMLRIVKNVMQNAVEISEENQLTI